MLEKRVDETIQSRQELLGKVPYLLGHHPADSVVAIFLGPDRLVRVIGRADLATAPAVAVEQWAAVIDRAGAAAVMLIGYGPRDGAVRITAIADALAAHLTVADVLLVTGATFYCLRGCACPAVAGLRFDPAATAAAARATLAGDVALPSRADLLALTRPDPGEQNAVLAAVRALPAETDAPLVVLRYLMERAADDNRLSVDEVARLARLLRAVPVRDAAWRATTSRMWQRDLWLDVTRRVPAGYVAGPASLAGWCAWLRGEELLAQAAISRALGDDPSSAMARLIAAALAAHLPAHHVLTGWPPAASAGRGQRP